MHTRATAPCSTQLDNIVLKTDKIDIPHYRVIEYIERLVVYIVTCTVYIYIYIYIYGYMKKCTQGCTCVHSYIHTEHIMA